MRNILKALLFSIGVAIVLCACLALKRAVRDKVDVIEVGILFACAIAAFWILAIKDSAQSRSTRRAREWDELSSVDDELVKLVRRNDEFSFIKCRVAPADAALGYTWVIQCATFDFNAAIAKVTLRRGHPFDESSLRQQIKADLKQTCGGWFLRPLVLGVVLETSDSNGWSADSFIDHNYAGGIGIAWLIVLDQGTMGLLSAHYPRSLRTTTFYDDFLTHLLGNGYALKNR